MRQCPLGGPLTLDAQVARKNVRRSNDDTNLLVAGLVRAMSKRSAVHAGLRHSF